MPASELVETQRQREAEPRALRGHFAPGRLRLGALGHQRVDAVDELAEIRVEAVARLGKRNGDFGRDPSRIRRQHEHAVAHQHRFLDVVRDHQDRFDRHAPFLPEVEQVGAQGLRRQHVERRERLVHQEDLRLHDQRAGEADALAHAARKLLGIGGFEAVEADDVDRLQRALARFVERNALRPEADFDIVEHGEPGEQREALEHHRHAFCRAVDRLAGDRDLPRGRVRQPGDDAQQRRLAAAGTAEQPDDFARPEAHRNVLQHRRAGFAGALGEGLADVVDVEQHRRSGVEHGLSS